MLPVVGGTPSLSVEEWQAEAPAPLLLAHRLYWGDGSLTAGSVRDAERARMHLALLIQLLTANPSPGRGVVETATLLIDCTVSHIRDALNGLPAPARVAVGADPSP
ncbi:hypothetical protein [Allonocardiopsis opalescens]|nr:hypothetical protein [Allonocardiopsis opalescens]